MALSNYDIYRISTAVVNRLVKDERFIKQMKRITPKEKRMLTSTQAAKQLGLSRGYVCDIARQLGGIRADNGRWLFPEEGLTERYIHLKKQ